MSDGRRSRACLGVEVWKTPQKWGARRSAGPLAKAFGVRCIVWLGLSLATGFLRELFVQRQNGIMTIPLAQMSNDCIAVTVLVRSGHTPRGEKLNLIQLLGPLDELGPIACRWTAYREIAHNAALNVQLSRSITGAIIAV